MRNVPDGFNLRKRDNSPKNEHSVIIYSPSCFWNLYVFLSSFLFNEWATFQSVSHTKIWNIAGGIWTIFMIFYHYFICIFIFIFIFICIDWLIYWLIDWLIVFFMAQSPWSPFTFHCMKKSSTNTLQNVFFCVPQKKVSHMGLKLNEGE